MLIILVGLPSVGKSTFSERVGHILSDKYNYDVFIVGTDMIREGFPKWKPDYENFISNMFYQLVENSLKNNYLTIVDDTNYYNSKRRDLIKIAKRLGKKYIIIYLYASIDTIIKRNINRGEKVPKDVIIDMYKKLDKPGIKYKWDRPHIILNTEKDIDYDNVVNRIINILSYEDRGDTNTDNIGDIGNTDNNGSNNKNNNSDNNNDNINDSINSTSNNINNKIITNKYNNNNKKNKYGNNPLLDIDKITRKIVGEYIKNTKLENRTIKRIIKIRKEYLKNCKKGNLNNICSLDIESDFKNYMANKLKDNKKE